MNTAFMTWADFFAMGGYGLYVWLAAGITLTAMAGLILHTRVQRRLIRRALNRQLARERRRAQSYKAASHTEVL